MSASADLYALLNAQNEKRYYEQQLLVISKRFESNEEKLSQQQDYESKYWEAIDEFNNAGDKDLKARGKYYFVKSDSKNHVTASNPTAESYAHAKVYKFDEAILADLADKDMKFDTLKTTMQAMCDSLNADIETLKTSTQEECADTHLLGGGGV